MTTRLPMPGEYLKYFDNDARAWKYMALVDADGPITYFRRFVAVASGGISDIFRVDDINPRAGDDHVYGLLVGVYPFWAIEINQPTDIRQLSFDRRIEDITDGTTRLLTFLDSPSDNPTKLLWIKLDTQPAFKFRNLGPKSDIAKLLLTGLKYKVLKDEEISSDVKSKLALGVIPALPVRFGGEF